MDLLIHLVVILIVLGLVCYLVQSLLPIPPPFKSAVLALLVLIAIIWILQLSGMWQPHWR